MIPDAGDEDAARELERRRSAGQALPARRAGQPANGDQRPDPPSFDRDWILEHPIPDRRDELVRLVVLLVLGGLFLVFVALVLLGLVVGPG